ncbi:CHAP domain-containing protein [Streptacidiphilus monticola]
MTAPATGRIHPADVALSGSLGRPSWWSATCDGNGSTLSSSGTFMGLQVCTNGGNAIDHVPGVAQLEWQCADLSDRYLVQRYGLNGPGGNGNQEAANWYNSYPSKFQLHSNGDGAKTAPVPGDVLSFAVGSSAAGHTGVVYKSTVDSSGNGTVYFVDQNWTGDGGYNSASVSNWNVTEITGEGGSVQWLHNPADTLPVRR